MFVTGVFIGSGSHDRTVPVEVGTFVSVVICHMWEVGRCHKIACVGGGRKDLGTGSLTGYFVYVSGSVCKPDRTCSGCTSHPPHTEKEGAASGLKGGKA